MTSLIITAECQVYPGDEQVAVQVTDSAKCLFNSAIQFGKEH